MLCATVPIVSWKHPVCIISALPLPTPLSLGRALCCLQFRKGTHNNCVITNCCPRLPLYSSLPATSPACCLFPGTYNDQGYQASLMATCSACPTGTTSSAPGAAAVTDCNRECRDTLFV